MKTSAKRRPVGIPGRLVSRACPIPGTVGNVPGTRLFPGKLRSVIAAYEHSQTSDVGLANQSRLPVPLAVGLLVKLGCFEARLLDPFAATSEPSRGCRLDWDRVTVQKKSSYRNRLC